MSAFDPPPDPPPDANLPRTQEPLRRSGRLTEPGGVPNTGAAERRRRRERLVVMVFLWSCVAMVVAGLLIVLL